MMQMSLLRTSSCFLSRVWKPLLLVWEECDDRDSRVYFSHFRRFPVTHTSQKLLFISTSLAQAYRIYLLDLFFFHWKNFPDGILIFPLPPSSFIHGILAFNIYTYGFSFTYSTPSTFTLAVTSACSIRKYKILLHALCLKFFHFTASILSCPNK